MIAPEVAFEVNLPDRWNRRFYMTGNGGLAGEPVDAPTNGDRTAGLSNGFVHATTNTGHDARKEPSGVVRSEQPAEGDRLRLSRRARHGGYRRRTSPRTTTRSRCTFSYWNSCSNGGRQGLLEAQRYPDDFDGIVANAPWVDQTGFTIGAMWNQKALTRGAGDAGEDGARRAEGDGEVRRGRRAERRPHRRPARLPLRRGARRSRVRAGADGADCLTAAQAATINKVYSGPMSNGKPFFAGLHARQRSGDDRRRTARRSSGWVDAIVPAQPGAKPADFNLAEGRDAVPGARPAAA